MFPFSSSALASLPDNTSRPSRYAREDGYDAIQPALQNIRVPRKVPTAIKVEGKVWFANERTWLSWLNASILIGTFAVALFSASRDSIASGFAYVYAALSIGVLVYGFCLYQSRITMIRKRDPSHYDSIAGPVIVSTILFVAVLANFVLRVNELHRQKVPIPGLALLQQTMPDFVPSA